MCLLRRHFWQVDLGHELPLGPPQLMMSFTADGQLDPALLEERDKMFGLSTSTIRESRAGWVDTKPTPHPAADHPWRTGKAWTTTMQQQEAKVAGSPASAAAEADSRGAEKPLTT